MSDEQQGYIHGWLCQHDLVSQERAKSMSVVGEVPTTLVHANVHVDDPHPNNRT